MDKIFLKYSKIEQNWISGFWWNYCPWIPIWGPGDPEEEKGRKLLHTPGKETYRQFFPFQYAIIKSMMVVSLYSTFKFSIRSILHMNLLSWKQGLCLDYSSIRNVMMQSSTAIWWRMLLQLEKRYIIIVSLTLSL